MHFNINERVQGCPCALCSDGPLKRSVAVAWAIAYIGLNAKRGIPLGDAERKKVLDTTWRVLERGGFTPAEARTLVKDEKR